jgi:hypothetical protein
LLFIQFQEVVSKPQIVFEGKASRELKAERTRKYVSISFRGTTQPSGTRWGFETTSKQFTECPAYSQDCNLFSLIKGITDFGS